MKGEALKGLVDSINERMRNMMEAQYNSHQMLLQRQNAAHQELINRLSQPKQVVRGADGKIVGVK